MPPNFWEILATALVGGLVGGGVIAAVGYRALRDRLREDFLTREAAKAMEDDIANVGRKFDGIHGLFTRLETMIGSNSESILRLQEEAKHRWEPLSRVMERMDERMAKHETALSKVESGLERTVMLLDRVERRMEDIDRRGTRQGRDGHPKEG